MDGKSSLQSHFGAEQADFVSLVRGLSDEQWTTPSLCERWTVRDVVTHATWHIHRGRREILSFLFRTTLSGFRKAEERQLARDGARSEAGLVEWLASPGRCNRVNLGEMMIHQQDVRRPLGLPRSIPEERISWALNYCVTRAGAASLGAGSLRLSKGLRFFATDIGWSAGQGAEVHGPGEAILMAVNGRTSAIDDLAGPGTKVLAERVAASRK